MGLGGGGGGQVGLGGGGAGGGKQVPFVNKIVFKSVFW